MSSSIIILDSSSSDEHEFSTEDNPNDCSSGREKVGINEISLQPVLRNTANVSPKSSSSGDGSQLPFRKDAGFMARMEIGRTISSPMMSSPSSVSSSSSSSSSSASTSTSTSTSSSSSSSSSLSLNSFQRNRMEANSPEIVRSSTAKIMKLPIPQVNCSQFSLKQQTFQTIASQSRVELEENSSKKTIISSTLNTKDIRSPRSDSSPPNTASMTLLRFEAEQQSPKNTHVTTWPVQYQIDPGINRINCKSPAKDLKMVSTPATTATNTPTAVGGEKVGKRVLTTMVLKSTDKEWIAEKLKRKFHLKSNPREETAVNSKELDTLAEWKRKHLINGVNVMTGKSPSHGSDDSQGDIKKVKLNPTTIPTDHQQPPHLLVNNKSRDENSYESSMHAKDVHLNGKIQDHRLSLKAEHDEQPTCSKNITANQPNKDSATDTKDNLQPEYAELIKVCRELEPTGDMEKLINTKLLKYYNEVPVDFTRSKSFCKSVLKTINMIRSQPDLVYYNLRFILDELKVRRCATISHKETKHKSTNVVDETNTDAVEVKNKCQETDEQSSTSLLVERMPVVNAPTGSSNSTAGSNDNQQGETTTSTSRITTAVIMANKKTEEQIRKLNKALYILTKRIETLEKAEVNWDEEDSAFLQVGRMKKRACQIYEKICDLTGESKNAHRLMKKPLKFAGTNLPQFNKILQSFINRTQEFPDFSDVYRMLEYCVKNSNLTLDSFEMKSLAEKGFTGVGKMIQARRKRELYESLNYFTDTTKDPAIEDVQLAAKLNENQRHHKKINDILDRFVHQQEMPKGMMLDHLQKRQEETAQSSKSPTNSTLTIEQNDKEHSGVRGNTTVKMVDGNEEKEEDVTIIEERNLLSTSINSLSNGRASESLNDASNLPKRSDQPPDDLMMAVNSSNSSISIVSCDKEDDVLLTPPPVIDKMERKRKSLSKSTMPSNAHKHLRNGAIVDITVEDDDLYVPKKQKTDSMKENITEPIATIDLSQTNSNAPRNNHSNSNTTTTTESSISISSTNLEQRTANSDDNALSSLKIISVSSLNECWAAGTMTANTVTGNDFHTKHRSHISNDGRTGHRKTAEEIIISDEEL